MYFHDYELPFIGLVLCINGGIVLMFVHVAVKDYMKKKAVEKKRKGAGAFGHDSKLLDTFIVTTKSLDLLDISAQRQSAFHQDTQTNTRAPRFNDITQAWLSLLLRIS